MENPVSTPTQAAAETVVTVRRGHAEPEELAAITAVLIARAAANARQAAATEPRNIAHWRRLERSPGFHAPHSWQAVA
ncbi:acyl-CoA carboxylase subunit epsilon [Streptantibioticus ferralitis]|uniref:Acyl-CoA carboxylase subunit epsilon n=1 Tax=Streptantibioticus ferralitis TaxID=236510 RepID=A0ABT5YRU1_9ACTN|nr:acyl-CoA carboxylase subunit epsilon [Streptantibioticus ferralitis]MDF2254233.1 acyl-CoA carboxylase subunit epsilon [Streptantibioticus ferralitis]